MFAVDDPEWRKWMNQHFYVRQGVSFQEMTDSQRSAAFGLLEASLSARGLKLTRDIMRLNETLAELTNDHEFLGEWLYFITVMGKPSASRAVGLPTRRAPRHHQLFRARRPGGDDALLRRFGAGHRHLRQVQGHLDSSGRAEPGSRHVAGARQGSAREGHPQPQQDRELQSDRSLQGQCRARLRRRTRRRFFRSRSASSFWISSTCTSATWTTATRASRWTRSSAHIDRTWFAWIGGSDSAGVYYYRIHSPVILIEFDHQRPANLARFAKDPNMPTRQHIHCVVRTPNGNDYGKDLLRQHYSAHAHA